MEYEIKDIEGYEGLYQIDNQGNVFSLKYGKRRKLSVGVQSQGYLSVMLCKDGKPNRFRIHRLVAQAFLPNPNNLPQVNHKDEDKTNNKANNLEWCTAQYNLDYSDVWRKSAKAKSKHILQYTKDGQFIKEYPSIEEAYRQTGINCGQICWCCKGKYKSAGNYKWKYKE